MTLLVAVLLILMLFSYPMWPYSRTWGYYPVGGLGTIVIILLILILVGVV